MSIYDFVLVKIGSKTRVVLSSLERGSRGTRTPSYSRQRLIDFTNHVGRFLREKRSDTKLRFFLYLLLFIDFVVDLEKSKYKFTSNFFQI